MYKHSIADHTEPSVREVSEEKYFYYSISIFINTFVAEFEVKAKENN